MMKKILFSVFFLAVSVNVSAGGRGDDPLLFKGVIDQFEVRNTDGKDPFVVEGMAWLGYDLHKAVAKFEIEQVSGETEENELQLLYSRAIDPYWDLQIGLRHDDRPSPDRDWLAAGFSGTAPFFIETDVALFLGEDGQKALRLEAEYEMMITQKLVLVPELEMNFYSKNDPATHTGSGLADTEFGLRLKYEIKREFAPYVGINWTKKYGKTADYIGEEGEDTSDTQFVVGFSAWF
jgi:copper resistance protein B